MQLLEFLIFFCLQKVEKTTLKSCSEKLKSTFFLTASTAQIWPLYQLYIEVIELERKQKFFFSVKF